MVLRRLVEIASRPGSRTAHLLPIMDLAAKTITPNGMGFTLHLLTPTVGEMDNWTWECLVAVNSVMHAPPKKQDEGDG